MSLMRTIAQRVLQFVVRRAPQRSRVWGDAMLRELEFIDDDWAALRWALGSSVALCRHSVVERMRNLRERRATVIVSVLSGVAAATIVLAVSMLTLATIEHTSLYAPSHGRQFELLFAVVIPDALCVLGAVAVWRAHARMASAVIAAGATLSAHSIVYFLS